MPGLVTAPIHVFRASLEKVRSARTFSWVAAAVFGAACTAIVATVVIRAATGPGGISSIAVPNWIVLGVIALAGIWIVIKVIRWNVAMAKSLADDLSVFAVSPTGIRRGNEAERPWTSMQSIVFRDERTGGYGPMYAPRHLGRRLGNWLRTRSAQNDLWIDVVDQAGKKTAFPFGSVLGFDEFVQAYRAVEGFSPNGFPAQLVTHPSQNNT